MMLLYILIAIVAYAEACLLLGLFRLWFKTRPTRQAHPYTTRWQRTAEGWDRQSASWFEDTDGTP